MKAQIIAEHKTKTLQRGFRAAGYALVADNNYPQPDDVLVSWNRKGRCEPEIRRYEKAGAKVIIVENGYIGRDDRGNRLLALAHNHHLGAGRWYIGPESRHLEHNFDILPWRTGGSDIVLLGQRGIGNSQRPEWYKLLKVRVEKMTDRKVRLREHPGKNATPLEPHLENAHAVITWSSSAAIYAMAFGVPVFYLMPGWIGAGCALNDLRLLEEPLRGDRTEVFHRIGWAQWTQEEVESGEAIKTVMRV